ncbi:glycosyltransferase family 4 protein [Candidatus Peregrinibacteria bacterium]|nr:glycosyltransferase family 4 protein [Candidatus Peregrinibacteria bacterium]
MKYIRACAHKVFRDGRDIFCSVQETTTKVCPKAHRGGVTQKWAKYVSSLRVEQEPVRSSLLLVACGAQGRNGSPRAANPTTFLFNHRKNFVCTGPREASKRKLKVLIIAGDLNPDDLGGAETHIVEIIGGLEKRGHKLHVFVGNDDRIKELFKGRNITWHTVKYPMWKNFCSFFYIYFATKKISKFLKNNDIDILHAKEVFPFGCIARKLKKKYNIPIYLTVQNPLSYKEELVIKSKIVPKILKSALQELIQPFAASVLKEGDIAACVSHYSEKKCKLLGARKTAIVPNGVDIKKFNIKPNRKKDEFWITTTSTLIPRNGVDTLIEAFSKISKKLPKARLKIAGEGIMKEELKQMVKKYGLQNSVEFLGTLKSNQVPELLNRSHIFVRPSRFEGFGMSFIEAMACGVPVITCPVGGIVDFIKNDETGIFVPSDQPKSLSEAMEDLMKNEEKRKYLTKNAYELVKKKYCWDKIIEKVESLYYSIVDL